MNNTRRKGHRIMSMLIGKEIAKALNDTLIKIEPLERPQIGPGSIDLTTGNKFMSLYCRPVKCKPAAEVQGAEAAAGITRHHRAAFAFTGDGLHKQSHAPLILI
jgi:hypothetical protein